MRCGRRRPPPPQYEGAILENRQQVTPVVPGVRVTVPSPAKPRRRSKVRPSIMPVPCHDENNARQRRRATSNAPSLARKSRRAAGSDAWRSRRAAVVK